MQGNVYIVIPQTGKATKIPTKLTTKLGWEVDELDPQTGEPTGKTLKRPTWEEVGEKYRQQFGDIRHYTWEGTEYMLIELELSFLKGEIAELVKLQKANKKDFLLMTNSEARAWLGGEDVFRL